MRYSLCKLLVVTGVALSQFGFAQDESKTGAPAPHYSEAREPCTAHDPSMQPFFGDFHVHTRYSLDASTQGARTTPDQAYRFALGEKIGIQPWEEDGKSARSLQLGRPLDFAMVSDHAELIGEVCLDASLKPWTEMQQAAEDHYDRSADCSFTAFVGYEWTGMQSDSGGNLHRNVVLRNAQVPRLPASFIDGPAPSLLWAALDEECNGQGEGCDSVGGIRPVCGMQTPEGIAALDDGKH